MNLNIHRIQKIGVKAVSQSLDDSDERYHFQELDIVDDQGIHYIISLFFDKASTVLPVGDRNELDQADSSEDYMGFGNVELIDF